MNCQIRNQESVGGHVVLNVCGWKSMVTEYSTSIQKDHQLPTAIEYSPCLGKSSISVKSTKMSTSPKTTSVLHSISNKSLKIDHEGHLEHIIIITLDQRSPAFFVPRNGHLVSASSADCIAIHYTDSKAIKVQQ